MGTRKGRERTETTRQKISEGTKRAYQDPELRERIGSIVRARWSDPDQRDALLAAAKKAMAQLWDDPDFREKMSHLSSDRMTERWADPVEREKMLVAMRAWSGTEEGREAVASNASTVSRLRKEAWADPVEREKMCGKMREAWGRRRPSRSGEALTEEKVILIRTSEKTTTELAEELGIRYGTVQAARYGTTWKHVLVRYRRKHEIK